MAGTQRIVATGSARLQAVPQESNAGMETAGSDEQGADPDDIALHWSR